MTVKQIAEGIIREAIKAGSERVDLANYRLEEIPSSLLKLKGLKELVLSNNAIKDISPLAALTELRELQIDKNQIENLNALSGLHTLETIIADYNNIEDIKPISKLPALKKLTAEMNYIVDLAPLVDMLVMEHFSVLGNPVESVQSLLDVLKAEQRTLDKLTFFDLTDTWLNYLSEEIFTLLPRLQILYLSNTRITNIPPEIYLPLGNGLNAVKGYFQSRSKKMKAVVDERVRIILVGNSTAGKSTLSKYIKYHQVDSTLESTHGIIHYEWNVPGTNFIVDIWDFGGQEYYHNTHRLFFRKDCLYVLAWEPKTNMNGYKTVDMKMHTRGEAVTVQPVELELFHLHYWLSNIKYLLSGEGLSPTPAGNFPADFEDIILVQTKGEKSPREMVPELYASKFNLDPSKVFYISTFEAPKGYWKKEWEYFEYHLVHSVKKIIKRREKIYAHYIIVRNHIQLNWQNEKIITCADFMSRIRKELKRDKTISQLTDQQFEEIWAYLDSTGFIMYFKSIEELSETIFLKPLWVADTIYQTLTMDIKELNGRFTREDVMRTLANRQLSDLILKLMSADNFELALKFKDKLGTFYIAPQYVTKAKPLTINDSALSKQFFIKFEDFFPKSFLTRVIIKFTNHIKDTHFSFDQIEIIELWKDGFLYRKQGREILIELISNPHPHRPDKIDYKLRAAFHDAFNDEPIIIEMQGLVDFIIQNISIQDFAISVDDDGYFLKRHLEAAIRGGFFRAALHNGHMASVPPVLYSIFEVYAKKLPLKHRVFVSYTHRENSVLKDFCLQQLKHALPDVPIWFDDEVRLGKNFEPIIYEAIEHSDIFVLLMSNEYFNGLNDSFILERELPAIIKKNNWHRSLLLPIYLEDCREAAKGYLPEGCSCFPLDRNNKLAPVESWLSSVDATLNINLMIKRIEKEFDAFSQGLS